MLQDGFREARSTVSIHIQRESEQAYAMPPVGSWMGFVGFLSNEKALPCPGPRTSESHKIVTPRVNIVKRYCSELFVTTRFHTWRHEAARREKIGWGRNRTAD